MPMMGNPNHPQAKQRTGPNGEWETHAEYTARMIREGKAKSQFDTGSGIKGALGGAATGFMIGGPIGALVGGGGGFLAGGYAGGAQNQADQTRRDAMDQAIDQQAALQRQQMSQRQRDIQNTMAFYGPVLKSLEHLYGIPAGSWGPGAPGGGPPPRSGMFQGMPVSIAQMRPEFQGMFSSPMRAAPPTLAGVTRAPSRPGIESMFKRRVG